MRPAFVVLVSVLVALVIAQPAEAKVRGCRPLQVKNGPNMPVRITHGSTRCATARTALRHMIPYSPGGGVDQHFRLAGHEWYCFYAHGKALAKGVAAYCNTPGPDFDIIVKAYTHGH